MAMAEKIVERVSVAVPLDPYMGLKALATYSGISVRTLRSYIDGQPDTAIPAYRIGGRLLVRRSEYDAWAAQFRMRGRPSLAAAVTHLAQKAALTVVPSRAR
jgi:hypothetical protein